MAHYQHSDAIDPTETNPEYRVTPPGAAHEHTDANVWLIAKFGLWLLISAVVIHVGMGFMFAMFVEQREQTEQVFPLATGQERRLPAEPRLQQFPENELYEFRQREEGTLQGYGWIDRGAGRIQIPIAEAMRLTVERGLPARVQQEAEVPGAEAAGLIPADSSSGRTMERRRQQ